MATTKDKTKAAAKSSVTSHTASKDDKKEKDEMLMGYSFGAYFPAGDMTPWDFLNDKRTSEYAPLRRDGREVSGVRLIDLRQGIEGAVIPPLMIWELGQWYYEFLDSEKPFPASSAAHEQFLDGTCFVCDGQGTPGNYLYNAYLIPDPYNEYAIPKHPMLWRKKDKEGKASTSFVHAKSTPSAWRSGGPSTSAPSTPARPVAAVPKPVAAPSLPAGVRFRCANCGHWFKENDLKAHPLCCPGGENAAAEGQSDWAVMCDKECGCITLDDVSACKPGFPRPKPVVAEKKEEVTMSTTEAEPEEGATPETPEEPQTEAPAEEQTTNDA